jgi:3',5'-cyclic-AMP phosphodiesterase
MEPPAYQIHAWSRDTGIISHTTHVGHFDGPHPFAEIETLAAGAM